ncbi:MAG: septum formation initiator family protein [Sphaerochaeta sp.]|jgi:cell division protein FtsB
MSVTRKILLVFALTAAFMYLILLAWAGKGGYLHNKALKEEVERLRYQSEVLALEVDALEQQRQQMGSADAIKDAAFKYGYQVEGEQVFYFDDLPPEERFDSTTRLDVRRPAFEGIPQLKILLISFVGAFITALAALLILRRRRR